MSNSFTGDSVLAEMTEGQAVDTTLDNPERDDQIDSVANDSDATKSHQLLDGESQPRSSVLRSVLDTFVANLETNASEIREAQPSPKKRDPPHAFKHRFGLPQGFEPRWQRYGRSVLLAENIYRLPDDREFVPAHPKGTLGTQQHLYALLTMEQHVNGKRGSVYVRSDGRIFDYSINGAVPGGDLFDTGYTMHDLERTGRYAPSLERKKKNKDRPVKYRRAAIA